jgi:hypothetical protein
MNSNVVSPRAINVVSKRISFAIKKGIAVPLVAFFFTQSYRMFVSRLYVIILYLLMNQS